jgi:hypothetical protein
VREFRIVAVIHFTGCVLVNPIPSFEWNARNVKFVSHKNILKLTNKPNIVAPTPPRHTLNFSKYLGNDSSTAEIREYYNGARVLRQ